MTIDTPKEQMPDYYVPGQTPREKTIGKTISRLYKGSGIWIVPLSAKYGDDITAMAINCTTYSTSFIELCDPFHANIEDYDGQFIKVRTNHYYCLKIDIADLKNLIPCAEAKNEPGDTGE